MKVVDVHNHFYPPEYLDALRSGKSVVRVTVDAKVVADRGPRFAALATLPLNDPAASVKEFSRALEQLQFPGAMLFSNVSGVALADKRFWPLYELADAKDAVLHIHPTSPVGVEA